MLFAKSSYRFFVLLVVVLVSFAVHASELFFDQLPSDPRLAQELETFRQTLAPGQDLSQQFYTDCAAALSVGTNEPALTTPTLPGIQKLKELGATVLLIPGYLNTKQNKFVELYAPQMRALKALGIPYKIFFYGEHPSALNAHELSTLIAQMHGPVVVITHSEGSSLYLKTALIDGRFSDPSASPYGERATKALREICQGYGQRYAHCWKPQNLADTESPSNKVIGWISLNGNFGSPLADRLTERENPGPITRTIKRILSRRPTDSAVSLLQMTQPVIRGYLADSASQIANLVKSTPVISLTTWFQKQEPGQPGPLGVMQPFSNRLIVYVEDAGFRLSDSIIPVAHQVVPGSQVVVAGNVPHYNLVKDYDPKWFLPWSQGREIVPATAASIALLNMVGEAQGQGQAQGFQEQGPTH